jgi:hypothetical protein
MGLVFIYGRKGGIDYFETYKKANLKNYFMNSRTAD